MAHIVIIIIVVVVVVVVATIIIIVMLHECTSRKEGIIIHNKVIVNYLCFDGWFQVHEISVLHENKHFKCACQQHISLRLLLTIKQQFDQN